MNNVYHYPPDLFELVVQTIPLLNRSKKAVLTFFNSAGIDASLFRDISFKVNSKPDEISKYEICRIILERINQNSDKYLRERREVLKRITEFESFSSCWESDQLKAKGLVAEIQKVINVKDSFTRMKQERDKESELRKKEYQRKIDELTAHKNNLDEIKKKLYSLFSESNPQKRGKMLESILNSYFEAYQILIKEDFKRVSDNGNGILEQIDGIIEVDNEIYLTEMKWKKETIGIDDIFAHLGRVYHRTNAHGIFISASGYSKAGIDAAKEALLKDRLLIFYDLEEFVQILEQELDFKEHIRKKIKASIIEKNPYKRV